ncbi:DUF2987 domain-containing protein [Vibrio gallicus]|uniref:DUF2987 domain-containing protein n=1 Tax=Vibrio gallicus TaxID=190897 RepID=UPI0021C35A87|nr:DUF2987 domain-containing protein [Vibrio gallicus]
MALVGACTLSSAHAQEYMFTYSKLYSPLKHNLQQPDSRVKVGLFFTNFQSKHPCTIEKAWMEKEQHYESLTIADNSEIIVPLDDNLRSANPLVFIHTQPNTRCDYSLVVLDKKQWQGRVNREKLEHTTTEMHQTLAELGGMFSSWFTPDILGVTLEFAPNTAQDILLSNGKVIKVDDSDRAILKLTDLSDGVTANIPITTQRVMPYIKQ